MCPFSYLKLSIFYNILHSTFNILHQTDEGWMLDESYNLCKKLAGQRRTMKYFDKGKKNNNNNNKIQQQQQQNRY